MAIQMPQMDGVKATRQLRQQWENCHILILTTFADDNYVFEGIRAGALSYMLKDVSGDELATAVRTIAAGHSLMNASVAQKVLAKLSQSPSTHPPTLIEPLSEREPKFYN